MPVGCIVKTNQNGNLALRLFFKGLRSWEGIRALKDTPENRDFLRAKAKVISREIREGKFDYLRWFPDGNLAHLFQRNEAPSPSQVTGEAYYNDWIKKQAERVRAHRVKDYAAIERHVLKTESAGWRSAKSRLGRSKWWT
jgi:Arm DNA-binding domain